MRRATFLSCVLGFLVPGLSPAQSVTLELLPSTTETTSCPGEELSVSLKLSNPSRLAVGGYQVFLRYPAKFFEPIRFEPLAVGAFTLRAGPPEFGNGFRPCTVEVSDPWADGSGDDVVAVLGSVFGETGNAALRETSADLGNLIFRPLGGTTDASGVRFSPNEDPCHVPFDETTRVFSPDGKSIALAREPSSFSVILRDGGPAVAAFSCEDQGAEGVLLNWLPPAGGASFTGFSVYRNGKLIASFPIRSVLSHLDKTPDPGTNAYEVAVLQGTKEGCHVGCSLERGVLFLRGDADRNGSLNLTDAVVILGYLFMGHSMRCKDAGDFNDDGRLDLTDASTILDFLFKDGPKPERKPPFLSPGVDPTPDDLTCES